ncbi:MAG TPA: gliding motility-associated C-terminal domain-containing protein, partial [Bacteroidetes bacterium]|nr:gliding motility-associated C-terminal domain-containing protein [Bacteroidota bacterium]
TVELSISGGISYVWSPSDYLNTTNTSTVTTSPLETITYTVSVTNEFGCVNHDEITITVYSEARMAIPKAFTPNGDGRNDVLYYYEKGMSKTNLMIFNRWGQMVFESTGPNIGWDGKLNGVDLEMDSYTYYLTGTTLVNEIINQKGNISLIR